VPARFGDLTEAGRQLAARLGAIDPVAADVVLGIARGGIPVALEVSAALGLPFDIVSLRRILIRPDGTAACIVDAAGTLVADDEVVSAANQGDEAFTAHLTAALGDLRRRSMLARGGRAARDLSGATTLLVDNGIRTGGTIMAAARALRAASAARVVVAVPVCNPEARGKVEEASDGLVCLAEPRPFGHVGMWFEDFAVPRVEEIAAMVARQR
jgi:putative phosphoribosyl transferase